MSQAKLFLYRLRSWEGGRGEEGYICSHTNAHIYTHTVAVAS